MISPRGRLVLNVLLLSSAIVFYTLPLLHGEPQAPRPVPPQPPKADLRQDPLDASPRRIGAGERHLYHFDLKPGEFVLFVVEQEGVDLVAEVLDRAGKLLFKVDGLNRDRGSEPVPLLAETGGPFAVRVSGGGGAYRVRIDRRSQATPADRAWFAGALAYWKGRALTARKAPGDQTEKRFRDAAREWERAGHVAGKADALYKLGEHYRDRNRENEALAAFVESLPLFRKAGNRRQEVMVRIEVGSIYRELGDNETAEDALRQALTLSQEIEFVEGEAKSSINLAYTLKAQGELSEPLELYKRALGFLHKNQEFVKTANKIGRLYADLGRYEEAFHYHDLARRTLQGMDLPEEEAATWTHFADLHLFKRNYPLASAFYQKSLKIYDALSEDRRESSASSRAVTLNNLGYAYYAGNELRKATDAYREAISLSESPQWRAVALTNLAQAYSALGQQGQALNTYAEALELAERVKYPWAQVAAYFGMAWAELHRNNVISAQQWAERAVEVIEGLRMRIDQPELRSSFLSRMQDVYELQVRILLERHERQPGKGFDLKALEVSDRARARSLYDDLSGRIEPSRQTFRDIQRSLDPDTVLLHYFLDEGRSHVFVVTPGSFAKYPLSGKEILEPLAKKYHASIRASHKRESYPQAVQDACRMSRELLGPLSGRIGKRRIVIVAPASLQSVSFAALPVDSSKACKPRDDRRWPEPLISRHQIAQAPSFGVLAALRNKIARRVRASGLIAILADPVFSPSDGRLLKRAAAEDKEEDARLPRLLFSRDEADVILKALTGAGKRRWLDSEATRDLAVKGMLDSFRILHFATHGRPNATVPAESAIVLSRYDSWGRRLNGRLLAGDIEELDLSADLVVLSACGTALGQEIPGEGLVGLTQAFFSAGAPRVVVTLWNVSDRSTVSLMETFYKRLLQDGPALALQRAQVGMWRSERNSAPYFWAQFVLQGEWGKPL